MEEPLEEGATPVARVPEEEEEELPQMSILATIVCPPKPLPFPLPMWSVMLTR